MTDIITSLNKIAMDCAVAEDKGTRAGALKAAQTRKAHGGGTQNEAQIGALAKHNALQKANWEELQSGKRMDAGTENPYKYVRALNKTDTLLGKPRTDSGTRFYAGSNGYGAPAGAKMHDAGYRGERAANREIDAQKNALEQQNEPSSNPVSLHDGMKPNTEPRVRDVGGTYSQYGTTVMMRKDGVPTREMPHFNNHDKSARQMNNLRRIGYL